MSPVIVRVPATSANLGPGFDCLGLALDLWNQASFSIEGEGVRVEVQGEGAGKIPAGRKNLIAFSALRLYAALKVDPPAGLLIRSENHIPLGSGLGSSSAAVLAGLLGANALLGVPLNGDQILDLAAEIEGHPDNAAPALFGSLVVSARLPSPDAAQAGGILAHRVEIPTTWRVVVVLPEYDLSTRSSRSALPLEVPLSCAVYNLSRSMLVVEALRLGDAGLLSRCMDDCLHQPYRLKLIPGADEVMQSARRAGAAAAALSGAGPSVIAFVSSENQAAVASAMIRSFVDAGLQARSFALAASPSGASVEVI